MTLVEFLLARIAEDKALIPPVRDSPLKAARAGFSRESYLTRFGPSRLLAECEAKRRIVRMADEYPEDGLSFALRLLALPYADHQDYDPAWRP